VLPTLSLIEERGRALSSYNNEAGFTAAQVVRVRVRVKVRVRV